MSEKIQKATKEEAPDSHREVIDYIVEMSNAEDYSHIFRRLTLALVKEYFLSEYYRNNSMR